MSEDSERKETKPKEVWQAGCGGVAPGSSSDQPRVEPPEDPLEWGTTETDPFADQHRDLSTNQVGEPLYRLPPEDGRDTWGWDHSPLDTAMISVYLMIIKGASLPTDLHRMLVEFVHQEGIELSDETRQEIIQAVKDLKRQHQE